MKLFSFIPSSIYLLGSCAAPIIQSSDTSMEQIRITKTSYRIKNDTAIAYLSFYNDVWYKDSVGITEVKSITYVQDSSKTVYSSIILGYRLVDMRRKWVYEYKTLSDTASIIKKYDKADSVNFIGGWPFFIKSITKFDSLRMTGDTTIAGVKYLKHRCINYFQGKELLTEILSRCDKKGTIFQLDVGLTNAAGCPVVKATTLTPDGRFPMSSAQIDFVSNEFPDKVKSVYEAWKRNVELFPVK